jgi:hypothetical protein
LDQRASKLSPATREKSEMVVQSRGDRRELRAILIIVLTLDGQLRSTGISLLSENLLLIMTASLVTAINDKRHLHD